MPVAKLSREFYEKFGDKLTDELVTCLNAIELSYRAELRDLFDAHFGRFEEKLERRLSETKEELRREIASLGADLTSVKADLGSVKDKLGLLKWNFAVWVPVTLAVIGLYFKR
jgi:hypothetical protein